MTPLKTCCGEFYPRSKERKTASVCDGTSGPEYLSDIVQIDSNTVIRGTHE